MDTILFWKRSLKKSKLDKIEKSPTPNKVYFSGIIPRYHMFWRGDTKEISTLIKKFFNIESTPLLYDKMTYDEMNKISSQDIYLSVNSRIGRKTAKQLTKKTGCKYYLAPYAPIGIKYTSRFLQDIAKLLQTDRKKFDHQLQLEIETTRGRLLRGFDFAKVMYASTKIAVIGEPSQTVPLIDFFTNEIGITPVLVAFTETAEDEELKELEDVLAIRKIAVSVLNHQDNSLVKEYIIRTGANLVFGRSLDRISGTNIVHITWQFPGSDHLVVYDRPILGFHGAISLVDYVINGFSAKWY